MEIRYMRYPRLYVNVLLTLPSFRIALNCVLKCHCDFLPLTLCVLVLYGREELSQLFRIYFYLQFEVVVLNEKVACFTIFFTIFIQFKLGWHEFTKYIHSTV